MFTPAPHCANPFDSFFANFEFPSVPNIKIPKCPELRTDIKERENEYQLIIDIPGYEKENVNLQLKDGILIVSASMDQENDEKDSDGKVIRRERICGNAKREFRVGEQVTEDDIKASFSNGVLNVTIPKIEKKEEVKYIPIEG